MRPTCAPDGSNFRLPIREQADFSGLIAIVSAIGDARDDTVAAQARRQRVPVNVVDRPDLSTFIFPAIVDRGEVVVAIGTGGAAPVLARRLRERIEALLPARIGDLAALMGRFRATAAQKRRGADSLRRFWERVVDGPIGVAALAGRWHDAETALARASERPDDAHGSGVVFLVGAGPGDPDLLTLRALQALQSADVVLYDETVGAEILDRARRDAERVFVGRRAGSAGVSLEAINRLLAECGAAGAQCGPPQRRRSLHPRGRRRGGRRSAPRRPHRRRRAGREHARPAARRSAALPAASEMAA